MTVFDVFQLFFFSCRNPTPPFSLVPITANLTTQSAAFQALADPGETVRETPLMLRYKCNRCLQVSMVSYYWVYCLWKIMPFTEFKYLLYYNTSFMCRPISEVMMLDDTNLEAEFYYFSCTYVITSWLSSLYIPIIINISMRLTQSASADVPQALTKAHFNLPHAEKKQR